MPVLHARAENAVFDVVAEGEFSAAQTHVPFIEPSSTAVSLQPASICRQMFPTTPAKVTTLLDYLVGFRRWAAITWVNMTEHELLRRYLQEGAQDAFGEVVRRHVDLVYSAARRQVQSAQLAEEVAQSVFVDLARNARRLRPDQPLGAWLYVVTRRTAIDVIRRESRRKAREQIAMEIAAMNSPPSPWPQVEPLLDEAMESLGDADRRAVLLRFFENQPLREIGLALCVSEDAAQKRVSRALEQLRLFFSKRGVAVSSAALVADLSAHAVQAAPAALSASIASAAAALSSTAGPAAIYGTAKTIAMTTTQKILVTATLTLALGTSFYEAHVISRQDAELQALRDNSQRELRSLRAERDDRARQLAAALQQLETEQAKIVNALASSDPAMESALDAWLQNVVRLKQRLQQMPNEQIPELQFLTAKDWLDATKEAKLDTDLDMRRALSQLRQSAKYHFAPQLADALRRYLTGNDNRPPTDAMQLAPFFDSSVDPAMLQRYGVPTASQQADLPKSGAGPWLLYEKATVDDYYDTALFFGKSGNGMRLVSPFGDEVTAAIKAFRSANPGQRPTDPAQLAPYLHSTIDPAFVQLKLSGK